MPSVVAPIAHTMPETVYWILRAPQLKYNISARCKPGDKIAWEIREHFNDIKAGHIALLWQSGEKTGLYGWGVVEKEPYRAPKEQQAEGSKPLYRLPIEVFDIFKRPVLINKIQSDPRLENLSAIQNPQGSSFRLDQGETMALYLLLRKETGITLPGLSFTHKGEPLKFDEDALKVMGLALDMTTRSMRSKELTSSKLMFSLVEIILKKSPAPSPSNMEGTLLEKISPLLNQYINSRHAYIDLGIIEWKIYSHGEVDVLVEKMHKTENFIAILDAARELSIKEGNEKIAIRHLIYALFTYRTTDNKPCKGVRRLAKIEINIENLLVELDEIWQGLFQPKFKFRVPGYAGDGVDGSKDADLLNLGTEVEALASVLSAKTVHPPLAIGLFGDWGSGKSFFLQQLITEINAIRKDVDRAEKNSKSNINETQFHKDIIQIEFNAWHYSEGDLWASLVDHIFTELREWLTKEDEDADGKKMEAIIEELDSTKAVKDQIEENQKSLKKQITDAQNYLNDKQDSLETSAKLLADKRHLNLWDKISIDIFPPEVKDTISNNADSLGFADLKDNVRKIRATANEIKGTLGRSYTLIKSLQKHESFFKSILWLVGLIIIILLVGPIVWYITENHLGSFSRDLTAGFSQILTIFGGLVCWVKWGLKWVTPYLKRVNTFLDCIEIGGGEIDEKLHEEELKRDTDIANIQIEIERLRNQEAIAERNKQEAQRKLDDLNEQIENTKPENRLAQFIEDRANSEDYRKKLGVLALVRRDFEKLSKLLTSTKKTREYSEERAPLPRIDRIILYIDDLDRCPTKKVVEVLQAIHLLLAFELFVVVVAVDSRWIKASLEIEHPKLFLHTQDNDGDKNADKKQPLTYIKTTAIDYLEKIFQIPYWVPPFTDKLSKILIHGLLKDQVEKAKEIESPTTPSSDPQQQTNEPIKTFLTEDLEDTSGAEDVSKINVNPAKVLPDSRDLNPDRLKITEEEMKALVGVASLAGQTPRQVKRFTNIYRLIKMGLGDQELKAFLRIDKEEPGFEAVTVLLAIVTGFPKVASDFVEKIKQGKESQSIKALADEILKSKITTMNSELKTLADSIKKIDAKLAKVNLGRLKKEIEKIERFSFYGGQNQKDPSLPTE